MKKTYVKPAIVGEKFIANEYVAACYKIKCTTPNGNDSYTAIYDDTNGNGIYDDDDMCVYNSNGFHGCGNWHKGVIRDSAPTANGFVVKTERTGLFPWDFEEKTVSESVFWWEEHLGNHSVDYHVMVPGAENYETNPNAS